MKAKLEFTLDENLKEVPRDPIGLREYVLQLELSLKEDLEPINKPAKKKKPSNS